MTRSTSNLTRALLAIAVTSVLVQPVGAQVKTWRVGDAEHPWRLSPVSGLINWGTGWSVEVLLDEDQDGLIDEDPVEVIDNDDDGLFNEDPPETQIDNDGDGIFGEDPINGIDDDGDGRIDEDPHESIDNDLDGFFDEDGVDEQVDNDGDGLLNEDGLWMHGDDDNDGLWNEDLADGIDNDGDGLIDEDRYGWMTDFDDDCLRLETNQFDVSKCNGGDRPSVANEDPVDGIDNDGDGLIDEDGFASERDGITTWLAPIRLQGSRNLIPLLAARMKRAEFGVSSIVVPTEGPFRRERPVPFSELQQGTGRSAQAWATYAPAVDGNLYTAYGNRAGTGGFAVRPMGFYPTTRFVLRPRPTFGDNTPHTYSVLFAEPGQVQGDSQRTGSSWVSSQRGDTVNEVKDFRKTKAVVQGGFWFGVGQSSGDRWEIGEISIFGDGFAVDGYYSSEIIDVGTPTPQVQRFEQQWDLYKQSDVASGVLSRQFDDQAPGDNVTWGRVRWKGRRLGDGTGDVRIQFRVGNTLDTHVYLRQLGPGVFDDRDQDGKALTRTAWANDPVRRAGIEDLPFNALGRDIGSDGTVGWSFWSAPFKFADGLIDESKPIEDQGVLLPLPAQTRYIQFQIYFDSGQHGAVALDWLEFEYDAPVVRKGLVAEVFPSVAPLGQPQDFRYFITPFFENSEESGFNRIDIVVPSVETLVSSVKVDQSVWREIPADTGAEDPLANLSPQLSDGVGEYAQVVTVDPVTGRNLLRLKLPTLNPASISGFSPGIGGSVEIEFTSSLFRGAADFTSSVWNDVGAGRGFIPQPAEPGDATGELSTNGYTVVAEQISRLMSDVVVSPNPFSPNNDNLNDSAFITFDLFLITQAIDIKVEIFDLSGRKVKTLTPTSSSLAGRVPLEWKGTDEDDNLVPPGLYMYRLEAADDNGVDNRSGTIAVAY